MGVRLSPGAGKVLYALLFNVAFPALLWLWARGAEPNVTAPAVTAPAVGWPLFGVGAALLVAGMLSLRVLGEGLPMNPWPPVKFVTRGVYALVAHPIYCGFTLGCAGLSLVFGSAAGLWLVTPVVALAAAALVLGYEGIDLEQRFGKRTQPVYLHLPLGGSEAPGFGERLGALVVIAAPFAAAAWALASLGLSRPAAYEPVQEVFPTLVLLLGVLRAPHRTALRDVVERAWLGLVVVVLAFLVLPAGPWDGTLAVRVDLVLLALGGLAAAPAFGARTATSVSAAACVLVQVLAPGGGGGGELALTLGAAFAGYFRFEAWRLALRLVGVLANSWRDWRFGPVRVINHGAIGALGCGVGVLCVAVLVGPAHAWSVLGATLSAIVGAALWAQLIEGSPSLARPYGFFGGMLGMVAFALATPLHGTPTWLLLGACTTAAPVIQGVGRLRCIANGCCHGAPCEPWLGIVYRHPMTRPVRLASLAGVPLHPTQLYSSLSNVVTGAVLARLWASHASLSFIGGLYLVLMGLFRFIEEAWRGEPQTPVHFGLRLYQWVSLVCVVVGAGLTCLEGTAHAPPPEWSATGAWVTLIFVAVTWLVASVDFPESKARFARLA